MKNVRVEPIFQACIFWVEAIFLARNSLTAAVA